VSNDDQKAFWSGSAGQTWTRHQREMDALLAPVLDVVLAQAALREGQRVLDIGCGTGASTLRVAEIVGPYGHVLGADISPTLLAMAAARLEGQRNTALMEADAATAALPGPFDALISRFGVMFFEDTPAAFRNIAAAMRPGAPLTMAAWADARENPYFMAPAAAARSVFGDLPKVDRRLPGPFAFEDAAHVTQMLTAAGLRDVEVNPTAVTLTAQGDLDAVTELCLHIGSAASAADKMEATEVLREQLRVAVRDALRPYETVDGIRFPALIHMITARA
jgi:SAM-dependent methyltransferase